MVEDDKDWMHILKPELQKIGFEVIITMPSWAVDDNKKHEPRVVQLDGLEGACFGLYDLLKPDNPKAHYFIYSGNLDLKEKAEQKGITFIHKIMSQREPLLQYVKQFLEEQ